MGVRWVGGVGGLGWARKGRRWRRVHVGAEGSCCSLDQATTRNNSSSCSRGVLAPRSHLVPDADQEHVEGEGEEGDPFGHAAARGHDQGVHCTQRGPVAVVVAPPLPPPGNHPPASTPPPPLSPPSNCCAVMSARAAQTASRARKKAVLRGRHGTQGGGGLIADVPACCAAGERPSTRPVHPSAIHAHPLAHTPSGRTGASGTCRDGRGGRGGSQAGACESALSRLQQQATQRPPALHWHSERGVGRPAAHQLRRWGVAMHSAAHAAGTVGSSRMAAPRSPGPGLPCLWGWGGVRVGT